MRAAAWPVLIRVGWRLAVIMGCFLALMEPVRMAEASAAAGLLGLLGVKDVAVQLGTSIQVVPPAHAPFRAVVTPSCSCLSGLLALGFVAGFLPRRPGKRRLPAVFVAMAAVVTGNVLRIAGSLAVGLVAGRASLVLFHDWVGSVFTFVYTLGGYLLMLYLLLPARTKRSASVQDLHRVA
jgi:carbamoyl-phosphate synthase large subunit